MTERRIKQLIESTNKDDVILGMEYYCRSKGLQYFRKLVNKYKKGNDQFFVEDYEEFKFSITQLIIKLPEGIGIVIFSDGSQQIGKWSDYVSMTPGLYDAFWVHEIMDLT